MVSQRYSWLTLAELKRECAQRDMSSEGTEAQLRQRLINWDELYAEDTKEFMDLPPEIREMIYTLCGNQAVNPAGKEWGSSWSKHNNGMVYQPPIFRTCKAIRFEGLVNYFKRQPFTFGLHYESDIGKILAWMERIGEAPRLHIRDMNITFVPTWFELSLKKPLLWIHMGLSDAATVRYEGRWDIIMNIQIYFTEKIGRHMYPPKELRLRHSTPGRFSVTFPPRQGWFGPLCRAIALRTVPKL